MSGPACRTSSAVASDAARTKPCIRPPSPFYYADAVGGQPAELGLLPRAHAALDVHARERVVGRDEERTRGSDLLPADVPLQLERPRGGRARGGGGAGGYSGLSVARRVEREDQRERQKGEIGRAHV